jgi:hypothetical protein
MKQRMLMALSIAGGVGATGLIGAFPATTLTRICRSTEMRPVVAAICQQWTSPALVECNDGLLSWCTGFSKVGIGSLFEAVWGLQASAIKWPSNVEEVRSRPGPPPAADPFPVHLSQQDRGRSNSTYVPPAGK